MYGIKETSKILDISPITVRRRIKDKKIRAYKEGKWKVSQDEIDRQLAIRELVSFSPFNFTQASKFFDYLTAEREKEIEEANKAAKESFMNNMMEYANMINNNLNGKSNTKSMQEKLREEINNITNDLFNINKNN